MRRIMRISTVVAIMLTSGMALASDVKENNHGIYSDTEWEVLERADKGKPVLRKKGDKVLLNLLNLQGEKVEIRVFDGSNRTLYKQVVTKDLMIEKAFNFENAYSDTYTIAVRDGENTYYESIEIK